MGAVKFEGVDILDSLGQIMELHTQHYKEDFDMDKELIPKLAASADPEDKHLLWMSIPCENGRSIWKAAMQIKCGIFTMNRQKTRFLRMPSGWTAYRTEK